MKSDAPWRLLAVLTALNVLSYVDRQLVAALGPLLIADLGLSRAELGLLVGAAFIAVFAVAMLVMGALADRFSRPRLIASGLGVWSAATALTGTASGFGALALWRGLVGVGEATLSPSALSLIAERFTPRRLGLATSVFYAGIPLGFGCSFALAGWIAPTWGWRVCFGFLGVAGLLAAGFVWSMADPRATSSERRVTAGPSRLVHTLRGEPALPLLILAGTLLAFASSASQLTLTWLVQERAFDYRWGAWLSALVVASAGLAGSLGLGLITDRARRISPAARLFAFASLGGLALPAAAAFYSVAPDSTTFYVAWAITQAWMLGWYGPLMAAIGELSPAASRGRVIGLALLCINLLGVAVGPWVSGLIGDRHSLTLGLLASLGVAAAGLSLAAMAAIRLRSHATH